MAAVYNPSKKVYGHREKITLNDHSIPAVIEKTYACIPRETVSRIRCRVYQLLYKKRLFIYHESSNYLDSSYIDYLVIAYVI